MERGSRLGWPFFDGAVSISVSMLLAALLHDCASCGSPPVLGYLYRLTSREAGVIIVATILLFPTGMLLYGGVRVFFAAREAARRASRERARRERQKGQKSERERIQRALAERGVPLTPELAEILAGESEAS